MNQTSNKRPNKNEEKNIPTKLEQRKIPKMRKPGHPERNSIKKKIHSNHPKKRGWPGELKQRRAIPKESTARKQTANNTNNTTREQEHSSKKQERRRNNGRASGANSG